MIYLRNKNGLICIISNKDGLYYLNDELFSLNYNGSYKYYLDCKIKKLRISFHSGINIKDNIIALTSNQKLSKGKDEILLYDLDEEKMKTIEGYSPTLSINNIALLPIQDNIICACKKNNNDKQINGILLIRTNLCDKFPEIMISEYFYEIIDFEAYCFCPISLITKYITNQQNNKIKRTEYLLVGGFDINKCRGLIKLFEILVVSGEIKISFIKDIEFNNNNSFQGFNSTVTCIIQTNYDNKIIITCYDGEVILFEINNEHFN